ncbi:MAG: helix-turn-helix transcriptional regulator, partial [Psychrobacter sp.]|nr:helix-turn-helix transcriptional regulator [Psychrobacter sp.]
MSMTESGYLIHLALKLLKCTQKSLAEKLDVSATQITKWKSGEYMSIDMREKMEEMLDLKGISPNVVLMSGSVENATEWLSLIYYLANLASEHSETGYVTTPLEGEDELESLGWSTFITLEDMGVTLPDSFPSELRIINNASDDDNSELVYFTVMDNPYASLIYNIYLKLNDVYGFYAAYLYKVMINEELDLFDTEACNIESGLMDLAASKLDDEEAYLANNFQNFRFKT